MAKGINTAIQQETAVLVGIVTQTQNEKSALEYIDELAFLAHTAGAVTKKHFLQKLEYANPKTFLGAGKIEDVNQYVLANEIDMVIFDDELSPSQLRNLEQIFNKDSENPNCKILDRNNLILDIFAKRAQTSSAKTQVELAQYQYLLPRLTRMWTHLDRTKGGIGLKGPGETEIETDRRIIRDKISLLKKKLVGIEKQMSTQRKNRGELIRVALVGYTNVGKSTIMNLLSKSEVFAENKLFATLDTTVRKVVINNLPFLLSDTVGFIRKLPHQLVESFKSTLDEARESDVLIHVVDLSHPNFEDQINTVNQTLADIGCINKSTILVFNKIDQYSFKENEDEFDLTGNAKETFTLVDLKKTWMAKNHSACLFISAQEKENINEFKKLLYKKVKTIHQKRYPYNSYLY